MTIIEKRTELEHHEAIIQRGLMTFTEVGASLMIIRDKRLYKKTHSTFESYCQERWGWSRQHATRHIQVAQIADILSPMGDKPTTERQARELTPLLDQPDVLRETWDQVQAEGNVTAQSIRDAVRERAVIKTVHVSWNSGQNEWYTPSYIIEKARYVMGGIELDPASSEIANATVKAQEYFTIVDNGLEQDWWGKVWLNPPYSQPDITNFAKAVITKSYDQIMILVNNATETNWFQMMAAHANIICLVNKRVKFLDETGAATGAPLQGQAILYKGPNIDRFLNAFKGEGLCLTALV